MCSECTIFVDEFGTVEFIDDDGEYHCLNGPASYYSNGTKKYFRHGLLHREGDLSAVIWSNNTIEYWVNGKKHREGGLPAVILPDLGYTEYWVDGKFVKKRRERISP